MTGSPAARTGFRTAGFREWPLQEALNAISRAGYEGVELCMENHQCRPELLAKETATQIRRMVADAGLQTASASYHGDAEPDDSRTSNQARAVRMTRALGTDVLILNARKAVPGREQDQWDDFARRLEGLLSIAEEEQVWIALEPEPGHFLHSSDDMARLIGQIQHPNLTVNLDVGHAFLTDADVCESIRRLAADIVHTHIEGMPAGEHRHLEPDQGDLDLAAVVQTLRQIGYDGYYTVDLFNIVQDPDGAARRSREALTAILAR